MSIVTLGDSLGSSLGSPEPPFCLVWSLLSSLDLIWNVSSARSAVVCCNILIFHPPQSKKHPKPSKNTGFAMFLAQHTISSLDLFWRPCCLLIWITASPRRSKDVPPMSIVALGGNLGSSLGTPEPHFCLVWCLLSSLSRILNRERLPKPLRSKGFAMFFGSAHNFQLGPVLETMLPPNVGECL